MLIDVRSSKDRETVIGRVEVPQDHLPTPEAFAVRKATFWVGLSAVGEPDLPRAEVLELAGKTADGWFLLASPAYLDALRKMVGWQEAEANGDK